MCLPASDRERPQRGSTDGFAARGLSVSDATLARRMQKRDKDELSGLDGKEALLQGKNTVWGGSLFCRFGIMCSDSSSGHWAVMQLSCCLNGQGKLSENILQNLIHKLPPHLMQYSESQD